MSVLASTLEQVLEAPVLSALVLVVLAIVGAVVVLSIRPARAPPVFTSGLPIIGPFLKFADSPVGTVREAYEKHGTVFTLSMLGQNMTFLLGPKAHTPFFSAPDRDVSQAEVYKFMTPVFGKGVVYDAPQHEMQQQLRFMSASLNSKHLETYVPQMQREAEEYFGAWPDEGEVTLMDEMAQLIILTASRCLMGPEIRETLFKEVAQLYHDLDEGITPLSVFFPNAPTPQHWKRDRARKEMGRLFGKVIADRRRKGIKYEDVLQVFMDAKYKDDRTLSDDEITGLLVALLFAGQHTSSITTTWTAMMIMHHPELQKRVLQEQAEKMQSPDLDYATINSLDLMHNCVKEAIRMYPPLIFLMRKAKVDMKVEGGYVVPKGDIIMAAPGVSMRLPEKDSSFSDPDTFDPDRYTAPKNEGKGKYEYIGFGGGIHACMGERFGFLQVKSILSVLFRDFEVQPVDKDAPLPDYKAMVVGPIASATRIRFKRKKPTK